MEYASITPLVLAATGGMANEATYSTNDWLYSSQENGISHTVPLCLGYVVECLFPCYAQPFNASGELGPVVATAASHLVISESGLDNI